ncbi:MAG: hypothetical protein VCB99_13380 [Myxococcota bacterium]
MAKKERQSDAGKALEEIQSAADTMAEWIHAHLMQVAAGIVGALVVAGGFAYVSESRDSSADAAAAQLAEALNAYLIAKGVGPLSVEVGELANPAAAEPIRAEFAAALAQVSEDYPDSAAATLSRFEAGRLAQDTGDAEAALALYQAAVDAGIDNPALRGLAQQRIGQSLEDQRRWSDAADAHEKAAGETDYPLRHWALADAARCRATAGDYARASLLYRRLDDEAPSLQLASHERSLRGEVRALAQR